MTNAVRSVAIDERIAERRQQVRDERRLRRLRRTVVLVGLAVLAAIALAVEQSSLVALAEVQVAGTTRLDPAVVRDAAALELGTSTLRLPLGEATARVEALPLVREARIGRVDPLTVRIDVVERVPVAMVVGGGGAVLVDEEGVVLGRGREDGLPSVHVDRRVRLGDGEFAGELPVLANALAVMQGLPGPLRAEVVRYEAVDARNTDLVLQSGVRVRMGRAERLDEKARSLGAILEDLGDTPVSVIDVRAPLAPTVTGDA